jgi:hypothetical protein
MHTAPAVSVQVDPEPRWRLALAVLSVLSALIVVLWWIYKALNTPSPWTLGLVLTVWVLTGWAAWQSWRLRTPDCISIQWSGAQWTVIDCSCRASTGEVVVVMDLGGWMLLRFEPDRHALTTLRKPVWIPLSEQRLPQHWHALRCAVHGARPRAESGRIHGH